MQQRLNVEAAEKAKIAAQEKIEAEKKAVEKAKLDTIIDQKAVEKIAAQTTEMEKQKTNAIEMIKQEAAGQINQKTFEKNTSENQLKLEQAKKQAAEL